MTRQNCPSETKSGLVHLLSNWVCVWMDSVGIGHDRRLGNNSEHLCQSFWIQGAHSKAWLHKYLCFLLN